MALMSMTGFARVDGAHAGTRWTWELRSVNGKGLDVRLRMPPGFEALETTARERIAAVLTRGNLQVGLSVQRDAPTATLRINEALLGEVLALMRRIGREIDAAPPTLDGLLALRGVVETVEAEEDGDSKAALAARMVEDLDIALAALAAARRREGEALAAVLAGHLAEIEALADAAERNPARTPEAIRRRLEEQVRLLVEASASFDTDRLHQEAVLLATKADIREEIDRLTAHVAAARDLIRAGGPVGRRLDFLAQEFNREVNTLCSKANDRSLTAIGLDLKAVVDQFREQIQNLE